MPSSSQGALQPGAAAPSPEGRGLAYPPGMAYLDGAFRPISEARISVLDWGFLRSDATYDVVHVWRRRFFRLDWHIERFLASVAKLRMALPCDRDGLVEILKETVRRSGLDDAYVEMVCTRGVSPTFSRDPRDAVNNFIVFAIPFGWIADPQQRQRGLDLAIASTARIPPQSVDPTVKNYHWLDMVTALFEAYDRQRENVLLPDLEGNLTEGPGFNLFVVRDGAVTTPARGVLEGITRRTTLALCAELGIPAAPGPVTQAALRSADEAFVTSTAGGLVAVTRVEGEPIGDGRPGPVTRRLTDLYWRKHDDPAWTTPVD